jgi:hypothetical protein
MNNDRGKILRVVLEYENETQTITGDDAVKWLQACDVNTGIAHAHGMNAFDAVEIKRTIEPKVRKVEEPVEWQYKRCYCIDYPDCATSCQLRKYYRRRPGGEWEEC